MTDLVDAIEGYSLVTEAVVEYSPATVNEITYVAVVANERLALAV